MADEQYSKTAHQLANMMESWFDDDLRADVKRRIALCSAVATPTDDDLDAGFLKYAEVLMDASKDPFAAAHECGPDLIADAIVRRFKIVFPPPKTQADRLKDLGFLAESVLNNSAARLASQMEQYYRANKRFDELSYCFELAGWHKEVRDDRAHHLIHDWAKEKIDQDMDYKFSPSGADAAFIDLIKEASVPYHIASIEQQQKTAEIEVIYGIFRKTPRYEPALGDGARGRGY